MDYGDWIVEWTWQISQADDTSDGLLWLYWKLHKGNFFHVPNSIFDWGERGFVSDSLFSYIVLMLIAIILVFLNNRMLYQLQDLVHLLWGELQPQKMRKKMHWNMDCLLHIHLIPYAYQGMEMSHLGLFLCTCIAYKDMVKFELVGPRITVHIIS